jgi:CheY-like chemotaxis protein
MQKYILIADDDEDDKLLFKEALSEQKDLFIEDFDNGAGLYKKLLELEKLPHLAFLDLNMPEMGGKDCLLKIRRHEKLQSLPVIIYSTSSTEKDIEDTYKLGANLYVVKPNTFSELKKTLSMVTTLNWENYPPNKEKNNFVFKSL